MAMRTWKKQVEEESNRLDLAGMMHFVNQR